ncbi:hypothetical protein B0H17DRAFT_1053049 [Mycena rosella]|uniref:Uncharacterized protein n=1 Tax=Mycena rosella TaxID=1033263 RepID=A0AAD7DQ98_MYCRO|nr:hypothetical protein B0H17DRAFT_1053049 [Mycena rosella]
MLNIGKYTSDAPSLKRPRDLGEAPDPSEGLTVPNVSEALEVRPNVGTSTARAFSVAEQLQALELSVRETDHLFSLPLHTADLGRLPIYDSFDYNFTFQSSDIQSQSPSHMDSQYDQPFEPIEPEFLAAFDVPSATGSEFSTPQTAGGEIDYSFDIPSGYGWKDWSTYLENVDGLNQGGF